MSQCLGWEENVACLGNPSIPGQIERYKHIVPRGENYGLRPQIYCKPWIVTVGEVLLDSSYVNY